LSENCIWKIVVYCEKLGAPNVVIINLNKIFSIFRNVKNEWAATLAGDLAQTALLKRKGEKYVGPTSYFNTTLCPRGNSIFTMWPVVMGPGQNFLTRVGSIFCGSGRVRSAIYDLGLNLENFP